MIRIGLKMGIERKLALALLVAAAPSWAAQQVGIVTTGKGNVVRLHTVSKLKAADEVQLQYVDRSGRTRCCVRVTGESFEATKPAAEASNTENSDTLLTYRLKVPSGHAYPPLFVGAGVVGARSVRAAGPYALQVDGPAGKWSVALCTSREGQHVIAISGSKVVQDLYWFFGYELEHPSCLPSQLAN